MVRLLREKNQLEQVQICSKLEIILTFSRKCLFYRIFTLPIFTLHWLTRDKNRTTAIIATKGSIKLGTWRSTRWHTLGKSCTSACSATKFSVLIRFWGIISSLTLERKPYSCGQSKVSLWPTVERYHTIVNFVAIQPAQLSQWIDTCRFILKIEGGFLNNITRFSN